MIHLGDLTPAAEEGWWLLFELSKADPNSWMLIGGQMMQVLAAEWGMSERVRPTDDVDVVVDVRQRPGGTEWLSRWLTDREFVFQGVNADGVGHRFERLASGGPGRTIVDVLAPDGLGARTKTYTVRPARTVQAPGTVQAFARSDVVDVRVSGIEARGERSGVVRRPNLLGALIAKAAATTIPVRDNPDRDWQDVALLLAAIPDPMFTAEQCGRKDRQRLGRVERLRDREHVGWANLDEESYRRGSASLAFLIGV